LELGASSVQLDVADRADNRATAATAAGTLLGLPALSAAATAAESEAGLGDRNHGHALPLDRLAEDGRRLCLLTDRLSNLLEQLVRGLRALLRPHRHDRLLPSLTSPWCRFRCRSARCAGLSRFLNRTAPHASSACRHAPPRRCASRSSVTGRAPPIWAWRPTAGTASPPS